MDVEARESRDRMIAEAQRQASLQDIASSRAGLIGGPIVVGAGAAVLWFALHAMPGLAMILVAGIGCVTISLGIAVFARAAYKRRTARARLRELETLQMPAARVVVRT